MSYQVSRRNFMKGTAAGGLALTSFGAPFGAQQAFAADLASEELRTVGLSVTVQERILADFKAIFPLQNSTPMWGRDTTHTEINGPLLFSNDRALLNKWFNELALYLRITDAQRNLLANLKDKATQLMEFYKNKHQLD